MTIGFQSYNFSKPSNFKHNSIDAHVFTVNWPMVDFNYGNVTHEANGPKTPLNHKKQIVSSDCFEIWLAMQYIVHDIRERFLLEMPGYCEDILEHQAEPLFVNVQRSLCPHLPLLCREFFLGPVEGSEQCRRNFFHGIPCTPRSE